MVAVSPYPCPPTFEISLIIICKRVNHQSPASFPGFILEAVDQLPAIEIDCAFPLTHPLNTVQQKHSVPTYSLKECSLTGPRARSDLTQTRSDGSVEQSHLPMSPQSRCPLPPDIRKPPPSPSVPQARIFPHPVSHIPCRPSRKWIILLVPCRDDEWGDGEAFGNLPGRGWTAAPIHPIPHLPYLSPLPPPPR